MRDRYTVRTQAAFVRSFRFLHSTRPGESAERIPAFNVRTLLRLHDMNPPVYVCAMTLLDAGMEQEEPKVIRDTKQFKNLIDRLGLQSSGAGKDARNSQRASLVLLEVFTYMILIDRARTEEEKMRSSTEPDELY